MFSARISRVLQQGCKLNSRHSTAAAVLIKHDFSTTAVSRSVLKSPAADVRIPDNVNVAHYVLNEFPKFGNKVAFVEGTTGREMTYPQLTDQVARVGSALVKQGYGPGDVVTIFSPNSPEFAVMYLAVAAIGGVVSAVNPLYTVGELGHALAHSESKLVVTVPELMPIASEAVKQCPGLKSIVLLGRMEEQCPGVQEFRHLLTADVRSFTAAMAAAEGGGDVTAALPYSSGTTGLPKGVELSHHNLISNTCQLLSPTVMNYDEDDVLIAVLPFFHIYGQVVVMLSGLLRGLKTITMPKFDPVLYLQNVQEHQASFLHVVPPMVLFLAKHPLVDKYDLASVHTFFTGAAPVGGASVEEAVLRLPSHPSFRQGYGLTEASPVTHCNPPTDFKYHTIGPAVPNVEFKICDLETGEALGVNKEGELLVKGPNVMKGYFKNPEATASTIKDGWLHTGDIGYIDEDEHVIISDRLKELIKFKGFQVAPAELEALLVTHPAIADAAVIGKPDERVGELPRAYVVRKPGQNISDEEVKNFVKGNLASYKQLSGGVEFVEEIPKSAAGKILRRNLKDKLKSES